LGSEVPVKSLLPLILLTSSGTVIFAQPTAFEVASIKVAGPEIQQPYTITGGPGTGFWSAPRLPLFNLLATAFGVPTDQFETPSWVRDAGGNFFTVQATMPPETNAQQFEAMLRNLLSERFHLVYHTERRNFQGYELVVDKDGHKLQEVAPAEIVDADPARALERIATSKPASDGFPAIAGSRLIGMTGRNGLERTKYQERTIAQFVLNLGFLIGSSQGRSVTAGFPQPRVVDHTNLKGTYTFVLEYYSAVAADLARRFSQNSDRPPANEPAEAGPDIFYAIQKQLGLRLNKIADVPVDVIVIDNLDKLPTPN
jgi:uncharacterized protein (TIGR03435 family)